MRVFVTGGSGYVGRALISALAERGDDVVALARSARAEGLVRSAGAAETARAELCDFESIRGAAADCGLVVHAAAQVSEWGDPAEFERVNVEGTQVVLEAARAAQVPIFVQVSTEQVAAGPVLIQRADESFEQPGGARGLYGRTKQAAEKRVLAANAPDFRTVAVRPRLVWGPRDTSVLPQVIRAIDKHLFAWPGGGRYLTSTCYIDNLIEGLLLAAERGAGGEAYYLTDGEPVEFRSFMSDMLRAHGVEPPSLSAPAWSPPIAAAVCDFLWSRLPLPGQPPVTWVAHYSLGRAVTVDDSKARRDLGYAARVGRGLGMQRLREAAVGWDPRAPLESQLPA